MRPTILWYSYRPGGIDVLCDSLRRQTHQDYELIMVDDLVERKKDVLEYLDFNGITPAYLGPSKKKCFPEIAYNCTNALNTGILKSTGDPLIVVTDYIWLPPKTIERFCSFEEKYKKKYCITIPGRMWDKEPHDLTQPISVFDKEWKGTPSLNGCKFLYEWIPEKWEMSCSAIPYEVYVETNGCPECWDYCTSLIGDIDKKYIEGQITKEEGIEQAIPILNDAFFFHERVGAHYYVDRENVCEMINHRDWPSETGVWHATKQKPQGSTEFIKRENTFNLRTHERGTLP